jgi:hypothetical protein
MDERKLRAKNVILYNIPECQSNSSTVRIAEDLTKVKSAIQDTNTDLVVEEVKVYRLGVLKENKVRPIKIEFKDASLAREILAKRVKFRNGVKANNDLTFLQRNQLMDLRKELETRISAGETNITIKYINSVPKIISTIPKN